MKRLLMILLATGSALLLLIAAAHGQGEQIGDRLRDELERTDEAISRAHEAVMATYSSQAKLTYENAVKLQAQARSEYQQGPGGGRWDLAMQLTINARTRAQKAISLAASAGWDSQQNETVLLRRLERADELLGQVREAIGQIDDDALGALYQSAQHNLDRANEFYREQQYRAALKLANQVERSAEKLLHAANQEARSDLNFDRQQENVRRSMEQAQEQISGCDTPSAIQLMERARQALEFTDKLDASGDRAGALRALQAARELATQALRECAGEDNLQRRYERLLSQVDRLDEEIDSNNEEAQALLNQASVQLELAHRSLQQNELQAVVAALKAAQLSLDEAQRRTQSGVR